MTDKAREELFLAMLVTPDGLVGGREDGWTEEPFRFRRIPVRGELVEVRERCFSVTNVVHHPRSAMGHVGGEHDAPSESDGPVLEAYVYAIEVNCRGDGGSKMRGATN